jgi:hypothetical protein
MKKGILALVAVLAIAGCEKDEEKPHPVKEIGCQVGKVVGLTLSGEIARQLDCQNPMAIANDFNNALVKLKVCTAEDEMSAKGLGPIGVSMCKSVGSMLFTTLTAEAFAKWECSGGAAEEKLMEKLDELCAKLD